MTPDEPRTDEPAADDADVVGTTFRVIAIEGAAVLGHPVAELTFGDDGRLTGCATVNRIMGPYRLDGDELSFGPLAGTLMAGPQEAMDQEQRLHAALARCARVVRADGAVVLLDGSGTELVRLVTADVVL